MKKRNRIYDVLNVVFACKFLTMFGTVNGNIGADGPLNVTTDTGMTPEMKTFYKTELLQFAEPELLFERFGKKVPIPQHNGNSVEIRYMDPLPVTTTDLTEGVTPAGNLVTFHAINESLHQIGYWVGYSDKLQWETVDPVIAEITKAEGRQAGKSIDTLVRDVVSAGSNVLYAPNYAAGAYTENTARSTMNGTAMLTIDLRSKEECFRFLNRLILIHRATNLFDNRTLAIHPASTIFGLFPEEQLKKMDVRQTTIRLSVGLEAVDDLLEDIQQALGDDL
jgi:hypothetical protein